jgi:hypothetical protein
MRSKPRPEAVGWWVGDIDDDALVKLEQLDWGVYTIVRPQFGPTVANDGSCECNLTANQAKLVSIVHSKGLKVQASPALDVRTVLPTSVGGKGEMAYREQYIKTIGAAVAECRFDGLEFDYEPLNDCSATYPENCTITPEHAHEFTVLMADIKKAMGSDKLMSEDVGVWGLTQGSYPLKLTPWVNVTMLNRGDIDFINTMSYHHPREGGILPWQQDAMWFDAHGFDRSRVNLGIGYYSFNFTNNSHPFETGEVVVGEPSWETLSKLCPNVDYDQSICKDVTFVGKKQNYDIGRFIQEQGWRGVFPWAASYDDVGSTSNNTMATWLGKGLRG